MTGRFVVDVLRSHGLIGSIKKLYRRIVDNLIPYQDTEDGNSGTLDAPDSRRQVFIFGTVPFYDVGGGQRSAQLAKKFSKMGFAVHYFFAQKSSESMIFDVEIPTVSHRYINNISKRQLRRLVKKRDIIIYEAPHRKFLNFINIIKGNKGILIYENIDNWETSLGKGIFSRRTLARVLQRADIFIATAKPLQSQLLDYLVRVNRKDEVYYLPNAVDSDLFNPRLNNDIPKDIVVGETTLLYYGSLWGEWFDWNIVRTVALECPNIVINLIGDDKHIADKKVSMPSNVVFLGAKKQTDLPSYLAQVDIAILPFKVDQIGEYVSPLKIFEYIAMDKLIISTPLPDIIRYPNVWTSSDTDDWIKIIGELTELSSNKQLAKKFTQKNNWDSRCKEIIKLVNSVRV